MRYRLGLVLLLALPAAQVLANDALLDEALARTAQPRSAISGMIVTTNTLTGGSEPEVERESIDLKAKPDEALASYEQLKDVIGADARRVGVEAGRTRYRFRTYRIPSGTNTPKGVKIDTNGEIEFDGMADVVRDSEGHPYVSHLQLRMRRATGPLIGRVKAMELGYGFAPSIQGDGMVSTDVSADVNVRVFYFVHRRFMLESRLVASDAPIPGTRPVE